METVLQYQPSLLESGSIIWSVGAKQPEAYLDVAQKIQPYGLVFLLQVGSSRILNNSNANGITVIPEIANTLDSLINNHPVPSVLLIDDEGNEANILEGADIILRSVRAKIICKVKQEDENIEFVSNIFKQYNYHVFDAENRKGIDENIKYHDVEYKKAPYYTLAIPQERKHT